MSITSIGLQEIREIRDRWAAMPREEVEAEKRKLYASAKRRMARIRRKNEQLAGRQQPNKDK